MKNEEIQKYVKHAEKFGTEGVMEAARDDGLPLKTLEMLLVECDRIDSKNLSRNRRFYTATKHRLTVEQRVKRLCGIPDEEE